jgi:hypothetical protein
MYLFLYLLIFISLFILFYLFLFIIRRITTLNPLPARGSMNVERDNERKKKNFDFYFILFSVIFVFCFFFFFSLEPTSNEIHLASVASSSSMNSSPGLFYFILHIIHTNTHIHTPTHTNIGTSPPSTETSKLSQSFFSAMRTYTKGLTDLVDGKENKR